MYIIFNIKQYLLRQKFIWTSLLPLRRLSLCQNTISVPPLNILYFFILLPKNSITLILHYTGIFLWVFSPLRIWKIPFLKQNFSYRFFGLFLPHAYYFLLNFLLFSLYHIMNSNHIGSIWMREIFSKFLHYIKFQIH